MASSTHDVKNDLDPHTMILRDRARRFEDDEDSWERGLWATQVYREHPEWSTVRKAAEVVALTLENQRPKVLPEERIVAVTNRRLRVHRGVSIDQSWRHPVKFPEAFVHRETYPVPDDVKATLSWWKGKTPDRHRGTAVRGQSKWLWQAIGKKEYH